MLIKLLQPMNALFPMVPTLLGMVMLVRLVQLLNAFCPILVTLSGMFMLITVLLFGSEKTGGQSLPTVTTVIPLTSLGIVKAPPDPV